MSNISSFTHTMRQCLGIVMKMPKKQGLVLQVLQGDSIKLYMMLHAALEFQSVHVMCVCTFASVCVYVFVVCVYVYVRWGRNQVSLVIESLKTCILAISVLY